MLLFTHIECHAASQTSLYQTTWRCKTSDVVRNLAKLTCVANPHTRNLPLNELLSQVSKISKDLILNPFEQQAKNLECSEKNSAFCEKQSFWQVGCCGRLHTCDSTLLATTTTDTSLHGFACWWHWRTSINSSHSVAISTNTLPWQHSLSPGAKNKRIIRLRIKHLEGCAGLVLFACRTTLLFRTNRMTSVVHTTLGFQASSPQINCFKRKVQWKGEE